MMMESPIKQNIVNQEEQNIDTTIENIAEVGYDRLREKMKRRNERQAI
jgi:hypothetical protein